MIIGVMQVKLSIFEAMTLKDKRRVIKSLKDRVSGHFNVSIAEVDYNDQIRTALLGVAVVTNERRFAESVLSKIVDFIRRVPQLSLIDYETEFF